MIGRSARRAAEVAFFAPLGALATVVARLRAGRPDPTDTSGAAAVPAVRGDAATRSVAAPAAGDAAAGLPHTGVAPPDEASLPIDDYDHLAASQILDRLAALTPAELDLVADYERAHRHRQTVLGRLAQLRS